MEKTCIGIVCDAKLIPSEGYLMYAPESKADDYCYFGKERNKIGTA